MRLFNVTFIGGVIVAVVAISWQDSKSGDYIGYAADFSGSYLSDLSVLSEIINEDDSEDVWRDTLVVAEGHTLNRKYDFKSWDKLYFDDIFVGDEPMLSWDSVSPSAVKLSVTARENTIDFQDPEASEKIKSFLGPISGFKRNQKYYEICLDSIFDEKLRKRKFMGYISFTTDYVDSCERNSSLINQFVCDLALGYVEKYVPSLSAFYIGYNPKKYYSPGYTGDPNDMSAFSDFIKHKIHENWNREPEYSIGSNNTLISIRANTANQRYVTFSKFEHEKEGIGHGMYTETFHTLNLKSGKKLSNSDIFLPNSHDKVKRILFEVMSEDPHYLDWHPCVTSPDEVEPLIESWQSPVSGLQGNEWEEPEKDFEFILPAAALSDKGVIFSFQPYEIDCWAAGAYHFIVPYNRLKPYLTQTVKRLIQ